MTDFHTHILPKIDDGPDSPEVSLAMLRELKSQGVSRLVLTPHYYCLRHSVDEFLKSREDAFSALSEDFSKMGFSVHLGAEVLLQKELFDRENIELLCVQNTRHMLVELDFIKDFGSVLDRLENLVYCYNITPIVAHVEKYGYLAKHPESVRALTDLGCLIQANTSLVRWRSRRFIKRLISEGLIHLIGSDCHNMTGRRPDFPRFKAFLKKHRMDTFMELAEQNACSILT